MTRTAIFVVAAPLLATSCGLFLGGPAEEKRKAYLDPEVVEALDVPQDLNETSIRDVLKIPEVDLLPNAELFERRVPRPSPLYADDDPDLVKIQRLGDRSWVILRQTPDVVWPLLQRFLEDEGLEIDQEIPDQGIVASSAFSSMDLLISGSGRQEELAPSAEGVEEERGPEWKSLVKVGIGEGRLDATSSRVIGGVEYGLRRGTAEVHFRFLNGDATDFDYSSKDLKSSDVEVEKALVSEFASFTAHDSLERSSSILVRQLSMSEKSQLIRDAEGKPVLVLETDLDRAWATIRQSLRKAEVRIVEDLRNEGRIEVIVSDRQLKARKMKRSLFSRFMPKRVQKIRHVAITVRENGGDQWVEAEPMDGLPLDVDFGERLLSLLKDLAA